MRILFLNWRDLRHPEAGGAERVVHELARRWVSEGHQATLLCGRPPGGGLPPEETLDGIRVVRLGGRYTVYPAAAAAYLRHFTAWAEAVVETVNGVPFFSPLYARKPRVIIIHHLVGRIFYLQMPLPAAIVGDLAERSLPLVYGRETIVTDAASTRDELVTRGLAPNHIKIIPLGVDLDTFKPGMTPRGGKEVLSLGRLKRYKSLDLLLEAFALLHRDHPTAHLHIVGQGEERRPLETLIAALGLGDSVTLHGFVVREALLSLMHRCRLAMTATLKEGWGLTLVEAMATGLPVVAFDAPGVRELVKTGVNGIMVPGRDPRDLAGAASSLLGDEESLASLEKGARTSALTFRWDRTASEYMRLLQALVGEGRPEQLGPRFGH